MRKRNIPPKYNSAYKPRSKGANSTGYPIGTGRPYKDFDTKTFEGLCRIQCTLMEICNIMDLDDVTINSACKRIYDLSFSEAKEKFSDGGKASLRRTQLKLAEKNASMAIWCGKQYLGQKDTSQLEHTGNVEVNVVNFGKKIAKQWESDEVVREPEQQQSGTDNTDSDT